MEMLAGGSALLLLGTCTGEWSRVHWQEVTPKSVLSLGYLIVFGAMLALSAYAWLLKNCEAATVATYAYVNPVIAVLLGAWFGGESFTPLMVLGAMLIVVSVFLVSTRPGLRVRPPSSPSGRSSGRTAPQPVESTP
jgi:drug/metabolite transporter (DMT)-like permease